MHRIMTNAELTGTAFAVMGAACLAYLLVAGAYVIRKHWKGKSK